MDIRSTSRAVTQLTLGLLPWVPTRGPRRATDVTAQWLTDKVGSRAPGAVALDVEPLDGTTGTTDRGRIGVTWNEAGVDAGLPSSVFIKSTPLSAKNRTMVASLDMAVNEVNFYRHVGDALGDLAPKAWFTYAGVGARHLLVLEDLVARGCRPHALADDCGIDHARSVIEALAQLHATYWEDPRLGTHFGWARTWSRRPGHSVLATFYKRGRKGALALDRPEITPAVRRLASALDRHADTYYHEFETGPLTLLHGDSHLGNTYRLPDGRAGLLDWQVVWHGPGLREVSYFLTGGLEPEVRRPHERELIDLYLDGLRTHGVTDPPTPSEAFDLYRLYAAEAWDATAMTIAWPGLQAPENMEASWRRACIAVEDNDVAAAVERTGRR